MSPRPFAAAPPLDQTAATAAILKQRAFRRLLAPGAHLRPPQPGDGCHLVFGPRNAFAEPLDRVPPGEVMAAVAGGWLAPASRAGDHLVLTRPAIAAMRRLLSLPRTTAASRDQCAPDVPSEAPPRARDRELTSPLGWLRRRKDRDGRPLITEAQFDAGERLAADFTRGGMQPRTTINWDALGSGAGRVQRGVPGAGVELGDAIAGARERVRRALDAVGPELAGVLLDVCCFEQGLEQVERAAGMPQRSGKVVLQLALTALARHYGLIAPESAWRRVVNHWAAPDYRPTLDGWTG